MFLVIIYDQQLERLLFVDQLKCFLTFSGF